MNDVWHNQLQSVGENFGNYLEAKIIETGRSKVPKGGWVILFGNEENVGLIKLLQQVASCKKGSNHFG